MANGRAAPARKPPKRVAGSVANLGRKTRAAPYEDTIVAELGERIKSLRFDAGLTLNELGQQSGVSRAMLSKVERGEKSCTLAILSRISRGLNITLTSLLEGDPSPVRGVVFQKSNRAIFKDPETGFERHHLFPMRMEDGVELLMHRIPAGQTSGELPAYSTPTWKYLLVHEGSLSVRMASGSHRLKTGEAGYFEIKEPYALVNEGRTACAYYVVIMRKR